MTRRLLPALALLLLMPTARGQDAQSGAEVLYREAIALLAKLPEVPGGELLRIGGLPARGFGADAGVRRQLTACAPALARVRQASGRARCQFVDVTTMKVDTPLNHLSPLRDLGRRLRWSSRARADRGEARAALEELLVGLRLASHVAGDRVLICHLVGVAIERMMLDELGRQLEDVAAADARWLVGQLVRHAGGRPPVAGGIEGERLFAHAAADQALAEGIGEAISAPQRRQMQQAGVRLEAIKGRWRAIFRRVADAEYDTLIALSRKGDLRGMERFCDATERRLGVTAAGRKAFAARFARLVEQARGLADGSPQLTSLRTRIGDAMLGQVANILLAMMLPAIGRIAARDAEAVARLRMTIVRAGAEVHRAAHGAYPATLDALTAVGVPAALRSDPFGAPALGYQRTASGYRLWARGPDLDDDQGRPRRKDDPDVRADGDVVYEKK